MNWLLLERYALGECDPDEIRRIEDRLGSDPEARAILEAIRSDRRVPPPLPAPRRRWAWALAPVALAAGALLAVGLARTGRPPDRIKGGTLALELVRLRDGVQTTSPSEVGVGDRLGLRLTCPPGRTEVDVVVIHGDEAGFPIPAGPVDCGNQVPIHGAFSVDAPGPLVVCVAVGDPPGRQVLAEDPWAADLCVETVVR